MGCHQVCVLEHSPHQDISLRMLKERFLKDQSVRQPQKTIDIEQLKKYTGNRATQKRGSPSGTEREEDTVSDAIELSQESVQKDLYMRAVIPNFLSKDQDYNIIQLQNKLIFLEDNPTQKEFTDQQLLKLLSKNQISLGEFLAGDRKSILESLQISQNNEHQTKKEKIIAEFNEQPLYVDFVTHYQKVKDTIFND